MVIVMFGHDFDIQKFVNNIPLEIDKITELIKAKEHYDEMLEDGEDVREKLLDVIGADNKHDSILFVIEISLNNMDVLRRQDPDSLIEFEDYVTKTINDKSANAHLRSLLSKCEGVTGLIGNMESAMKELKRHYLKQRNALNKKEIAQYKALWEEEEKLLDKWKPLLDFEVSMFRGIFDQLKLIKDDFHLGHIDRRTAGKAFLAVGAISVLFASTYYVSYLASHDVNEMHELIRKSLIADGAFIAIYITLGRAFKKFCVSSLNVIKRCKQIV